MSVDVTRGWISTPRPVHLIKQTCQSYVRPRLNSLWAENVVKCIPSSVESQIAKFMGPTWGPSGSCRPQMGPCWPHEPCYQGCFNSHFAYSTQNRWTSPYIYQPSIFTTQHEWQWQVRDRGQAIHSQRQSIPDSRASYSVSWVSILENNNRAIKSFDCNIEQNNPNIEAYIFQSCHTGAVSLP